VDLLEHVRSRGLGDGGPDPRRGVLLGAGPRVGADGDDLRVPVSTAAQAQFGRPALLRELHRRVARSRHVVGHDHRVGSHVASAGVSGSVGFCVVSAPDRFSMNAAMIGARIAVTSAEAAICAVAVPTYCWNVGSAAATTAGVAIALPAVVPAAKPMPDIAPLRNRKR